MLVYRCILLAVVVMFVRAVEYGPVQSAQPVVALTANAYVVHAVRPVTLSDVALVLVFTATELADGLVALKSTV